MGIPEGSESRKNWIDALRAFALILVIYGHHLSSGALFYVFTSPVKIPLFFAVSAMVFNEKRTDPKAFFLNLLKRLVIPWLALTILPSLILIPMEGFAAFAERLAEIVTGEYAWYMPCCIVSQILWFLIRKLTRKTEWTCLAAAVFFAAGTALADHGILDVLMINRGMCALLFMAFGLLYREYGERAAGRKTAWLVSFSAVYAALGVLFLVLFPGRAMEFHYNIYHSYVIVLPMIAAGIAAVSLFAEHFARAYPRWLLYIGRNTLPIYLLHLPVLSVMNKAQRMLPRMDPFLSAALLTAVTCAVCCAMAAVLNRFLPELTGGKRIGGKI